VHTATLLSSGKVLVAGGNGNSPTYLASAEVFDPSSGGWTTVAPLKRRAHEPLDDPAARRQRARRGRV
jgi:hypothetical protein